MAVTIYGLFSASKCYYVGSADSPREREKQHRSRLPVCVKSIPEDWEMREICRLRIARRLDAMRAEGYWILRLKSEGHPLCNTSLEGWPQEAMTNTEDWWPVIAAWASESGIHTGTVRRFVSLTEAASISGKSKQFIAMSARSGRIPGAVQVAGKWQIPKEFAISSEPVMASRMEATERALKLVAKGMTPYAAAKKVGIALSTIYRAIKREKEKSQ